MSFKFRPVKFAAAIALLSLAQCKSLDPAGAVVRETPDVAQAETSAAMALPLPAAGGDDATVNEAAVAAVLKKNKVAPDVVATMAPKIAHYLAFIGVQASPTAHAKADLFDKTLARLLESSTQFLVCPDFVDWGCLERDPQLPLKGAYRQASAPGLGEPVAAGEAFRAEWFFTQQWDKAYDPAGTSMARNLAEKIASNGTKSISMAAYGVRAIAASIKPVWDALNARIQDGAVVRAVVDQKGFVKTKYDILFSYVKPPASALGSGAKHKVWAFAAPKPDELAASAATPPDSPVQAQDGDAGDAGSGGADDEDDAEEPPTQAGFLSFEYSNTPDLLNLLNAGAQTNADARARVEWPSASIMHNKFFVFENQASAKSVWTGTTNISDTCMGEERNSNFGIWVDNDAIASTYLAEFEEMYEYDTASPFKTKAASTGFAAGKFHRNKRPNTKRYFRFDDGTEVRVHFAPTDDGEHRALVPMLLSARAGDKIRVAMFGSSGLELVRAFQFAAAQGAHVQILLDKQQGAGLSSWARAASGNLAEPNPYDGGDGEGSLEWKLNGWDGKNHHKSATLTRADGTAEILVTGSQNWSVGGNDKNDENMMSIRNTQKGLDAARDFNEHFDSRLWPHGVTRSFKKAQAN